MIKKFTTKYLTAWIILLILAIGFLIGFYPFAQGTFHMLRNLAAGNGMDVSIIENNYNEYFPAKEALITINGGVQRLLGVREVNERCKLDNGQLTYIIPEYDTAQVAENTVAFSRSLEAQGIPLVYVNAPFKVYAKDPQLPLGVTDCANENADRFLGVLRAQGVRVLDLRDCIEEDGLDHYSLFYKTDHHWTAETGFWAFTRISGYLESLDSSFAVDDRIKDPDNYTFTVHENIFLGSAGRRVGPIYAGKDDLTVITPRFDTSLRFYGSGEETARTGSYQQTVLFPENLSSDGLFNSKCYNVYCNQDYGKLELSNYSAREGLELQSASKRLLVFKDSFSSVVIPFLALGYEEICFIDLRLYEEDVETLIAQFQPDMVLVSYNVGALEAHNSIMFDFQK